MMYKPCGFNAKSAEKKHPNRNRRTPSTVKIVENSTQIDVKTKMTVRLQTRILQRVLSTKKLQNQ
jgi:hypothetical protein